MIRAFVVLAGLLLIVSAVLALFGLPVWHSLGLLLDGAFGDRLAITRTLVKTVPLTITAMGIVVAWRAGMYNIGGEGQFVIGGLAAATLAPTILSWPSWLGVPLLIVASLAGGAVWGLVAGWLKVVRGVEVVISTILLNVIAVQLLAWAVSGPLRDRSGGVPLTLQLPDRLMIPRFDPQSDLHAGIFVAVLAVGAVYLFLYFTAQGFRIRLVGEGERAARANGIVAGAVRLQAMAISGSLCGLAGGVEYLGIAGQLGSSFAQQWGYLAIPVALLGGLHPLVVAISALFFGALFAGSRNLAGFTAQGTTLIYVIQAAAMLGFVALGAIKGRSPVPAKAN